jgi:hypothetical protein
LVITRKNGGDGEKSIDLTSKQRLLLFKKSAIIINIRMYNNQRISNQKGHKDIVFAAFPFGML